MPGTNSGPEFDDDTRAVLREVAEWWQRRKQEDDHMVGEARPIFRRVETTTRSVRLDKKMLDAVERKCRKERLNFNSLVEWLVWKYLDCDPAFVEPPED